MLTEIGPVEIDVPRDTDASFDPKIVRKRQRPLDGIDEIVLSLTARGLTTGEVAAHFDEVYGAKVSKETISKITDKVVDQMAEWSSRPLDSIYPVIFVDALVIKVRDGQVVSLGCDLTGLTLPRGQGSNVRGEHQVTGSRMVEESVMPTPASETIP